MFLGGSHLTWSELRSAIVRELVVVTPETPLQAAIARWLDDPQGSSLPCCFVVAGDRLQGLVYERNVLNAIARSPAAKLTVTDLTVADVMQPPVTVLHDAQMPSFCELVEHLRWATEAVVPVLDAGDRLIGAISARHLLPQLHDRCPFNRPPIPLPVGIFRTDTEGNCVEVNPRWCELTGLTSATAAGRGWMQALHPDDRDRVVATWTRAVRQGQPWRCELRYRRPDGRIAWVYAQAVPERDALGQVFGYLGTTTDISDRKQTELALTAKSAELDRFFSLSLDLLCITNTSGQFHRLNRQWETTLGYPLHQLEGSPLLNYIHPDDLDATQQALTQLDVGKPVIQFVNRYRCRDGSYRWLEWRAVPAPDSDLVYAAGRDITDRRRAEQTLRRSEARWQFALEGAGEGVWDWNLNTDRVFYTDRWKALLGYDRDDVGDRLDEWRERVHPDDLPQSLAAIDAHLRGDTPVYISEHRLRHKDGRYIWTLDRGKVVERNPDGTPRRIIGTQSDISDRKRAEAERLEAQHLRLELRLLEKLFDTVLAGYWDWDILQHREYYSPGFKRMFGYEPDELPDVPETWQQLVVPADLPHALDGFDRHVRSGGEIPFNCEVRYRHRNGTILWVLCAGQVIAWDDDGQPLRAIGFHFDITARKDAEEQLHRSDAHLRTAQQIAGLGSWEFDPQTQKIIWSDETFRMFDRPPHLGEPDFDTIQQIIHPDDRERHRDTFEAALAAARPYEIEIRLRCNNGEIRHILARGKPVFDAAGEMTRFVGTALDLTDRKRSEAKVRQYATQLELSNRELEAFAYSVSHDLRAPLRAIDGFSQALLEDYGDRVDEMGQDYFARIRRNVTRMGTLIDDLLSLSRVSRLELRYTTVNLSHLAEELVRQCQERAPERPVAVAIAPDIQAIADATLMRVVLTNLIENAWKFTSHRSHARIEFGVLEIDAANENATPGDPGTTTYFVRDNGAGFEMDYVHKLFGVFQRLHSDREFPGTGIGLANVQRAVARHGGRVWAQGAIDRGATFYFTLPDRPELPSSPPSTAAPPPI